MADLEKYYNKFHEENRLKTRHGLVEFNTSLHYIKECISRLAEKNPSAIKIADIGAGTGRYLLPCHRLFGLGSDGKRNEE